MNILKSQQKILKTLTALLLFVLLVPTYIGKPQITHAAFNEQINYQGKLLDNTGAPVTDGDFSMVFRLYTVPTGGSNIWTETQTVPVTSGLFSTMLGTTTSLSSVDFNQTLYLGVNIAGDGEMLPRKVLGAVPAAFEANNAGTVGNVASSSFLRADQDDTASGLLTLTGGLISSGATTITNLTATIATTTTLVINGESFTDLTGTGLSNNSGVLTLDTSSLDGRYASSTDFDTESELESLLSDVTNIFTNNDTITAANIADSFVLNTGDTMSGTLTMGGSTANIALGSNWLSGDGTDKGIYVATNGSVGIGTSTPQTELSVVGELSLQSSAGNIVNMESDSSVTYFNIDNTNTGVTGYRFYNNGASRWIFGNDGNNSDQFKIAASSAFGANEWFTINRVGGNVGIGTSTPNAKLTVAGDINIDNSDTNATISYQGSPLISASSTNDSLAFGFNAGLGGSGASDRWNVAIGRQTMQNADGVAGSVAIGYNAGQNTSGGEDVMIGGYAGAESSGLYNVMIGYGAGQYMTGWENVVFGNQVAGSMSGWDNIAMGVSSGYNDSGNNNVYLGYDTASNKFGGDDNIYIGTQAGRYATTSNNTVAVGAYSLYGISGSRHNSTGNVALGYRAGYGVNNAADNNILIGYQAADSLTTGANNLIIGYDVEAPSNTGSNQLNIGNLIFGTGIDGTGTTLSSGNVGIGTTSPSSKLDVWGDFRVGTSSTPALAVDTATQQVMINTATPFATDTPRLYLEDAELTFRNTASPANSFSLNVSSAGDAELSYTRVMNIYDNGQDVLAMSNNSGFLFNAGGNASQDLRFYGDTLNDLFFIDAGTQKIGVATDTPAYTFVVDGDIHATGALYDNNNSAGTADYVLQSTGTGFQWVATTTLGLGGAASLTVGTDNQIPFSNAGGTDFDYSSNLIFDGSALTVVGTGQFENNLTLTDGVGDTPQLVFQDSVGSTSAIYMNGSTELVFETPDAMDFIATDPGATNKTYNMFRVSQASRPGDMFFRIWGDGTGNEYLELSHNGFDGRLQTGAGDLSLESFTKRVAINETSPDAIFEVSGDGLATDLFFVSSNDDTDGDIFSILNNGNVGIGTTSPSSKLDVWGGLTVGTSSTPALYVNPANSFVGVNRTSSGGSQGYSFAVDGGMYSNGNIEMSGTNKIFGTNTGTDTGLSFPASNTILLESSNSDVLRMSNAAGSIFNGGNQATQDFRIEADIIDDLFFADAGLQFVGIATDTPAYTFVVDGDIHATGALYDNNNSAGTSGYVLQTTGTGFAWVATSTLGTGGSSLLTDAGAITYLTGTSDIFMVGTTSTSTYGLPNVRMAVQNGTFVSAPGDPSVLSSTEIGNLFSAVINDDVFYTNISTTIYAINVSDPTNTPTIGTVDVTASPVGTALSGNYLYTFGDGGSVGVIDVIDVSNPNNMTVVATTSVTGSSAYAIEARGTDIYVTTSSGFYVYSARDPQNIRLRDSFVIDLIPKDIELQDNYAYVASQNVTGQADITVVDISDPDNLVKVSEYTSVYYATAIDVKGNYLYAIDGAASGHFHILDITDPFAVAEVGSTTVGFAKEVHVRGDYAYVVVNDAVEIYNVNDPANIVQVSSKTISNVDEIAINGNTLYAAGYNSIGDDFFVLDLGGINSPTGEIGSLFATALQTRDFSSEKGTFQGSLAVGHDAFVGGKLSVVGTASTSLMGSNTGTAFSVASGYSGFGTTSASQRLTVDGSAYITGALYDNNNSAGTSGYVLQSTGSGFQWVATTTLGLGGAASLTVGTDNQIPFSNAGGDDFEYDSGFTFDGLELSVGGSINIAANNLGYEIGGTRILYSSTTNDSIAIGENAGSSLLSGGLANNALGYYALSAATSSDRNTAIGYESMRYTTSGSYNTAMGYRSLVTNTTGQYNTAIGYLALEDNTSGSYNTALGSQALFNNIDGVSNFAIGYQALRSNTIGDYNVAVGDNAAASIVEASNNVAIGHQAMWRPTTTANSVVIGKEAGLGTVGFSYTNATVMGYQAGKNLSSGSNNTLLGYRVADSLTTGSNNIIIGYDVEAPSNTASNQLNIGNLIFGTGIDGTGTTLSSGNIGIGTNNPNATLDVGSTAPYIYVSDSDNAGVSDAHGGGLSWRTGSNATYATLGFSNDRRLRLYNEATGSNANLQLKTEDNITFDVGGAELMRLDGGLGNVGIGTTSPGAKLTVVQQTPTVSGSELVTNGTFTGSATGWTLQSGCSVYGTNNVTATYDATCQGDAGWPSVSTSFTTVTGTIYRLTFDLSSVSDDYVSLYFDNVDSPIPLFTNGSNTFYFIGGTTGTETIYFDLFRYNNDATYTLDNVSIQAVTSTMQPTFVVNDVYGQQELTLGLNYLENFFMGPGAGSAVTTGYNNTAVGSQALARSTTANNSSAFGAYALTSNTTGVYNSAFGAYALVSNTTGGFNTAFGSYTLADNISGSNNTAFGDSALQLNLTGISNTAIGHSALSSNTSGAANVSVGTAALYGNATGGQNVGVGWFALYNNKNGFSNVALGANAARYLTDGSSLASSTDQGVFLGANTETLTADDVNSIIIGYGAEGLGSNTVVLGNNSITTTALKGNIGIGTTSPSSKLDVWGDFRVGTSGTPLLLANTSGNFMGIGTSTQSGTAVLNIEGNVALDTNSVLSDNGGNYGLAFGSGAAFFLGLSGGESTTYFNNSSDGDGDGTALNFSTGNFVNTGKISVINDGDATNSYIAFTNKQSGSLVEALRITSSGNVGIGTTSPASKLDVWGDFRVGTSGTPTLFVDASTGHVGFNDATPGTNISILPTASGEGIELRESDDGNLAATLYGYDSGGVFSLNSGGVTTFQVDAGWKGYYTGGNFGFGTTTPESLLHLENTGLSGAVNAGIKQDIGLLNTTLDAVQYGDRSYVTIDSTATSTVVGGIIRLEDNTALGNVVRGFEVQANKGANTQGENTALSGFARTFGVRGYSSGDAGGVYEPAGGYFETGGSTQGNAIRGYSSTITTSDLLSLFQEDSAFTGTGLLMNFGNDTGSFASTSSKFVDFQNAGTSKFTVTAHGTTTIGDGTTNNMAGLQIGYGGLCVDNDGSCVASTTGRISSVSSYTGNSDLAEMYFSSQSLEPGEIVVSDSFISVERANGENGRVLGVVSTKPGLLMGSDDTPLKAGQGYPLALSGRVPVKLSDENGPVAVGDPLTLSSLPGVAMKADDASEIVGYALEAFDGTYAYTAGYVNQFGDDIAEPDYSAINVNEKANATNGCYFGAGGEAGATSTEVCDPEVVIEVLASDEPTAEEIAQARYDAEQAALEALRQQRAETKQVDGQTVKVGRVTMFVDRGIHIASGQVDILNELTATSTDLVLGADEDSGETLWSRLKELAQNFVDGVLTITGIKTNLVESDRVETSELCVDDVCVTADDLRALLQGATTEESASETHTADQTQTETAPVGNGDTSETNEPVATSTQQSASTTPEMVTEAEAQETSTTSVETEAVAETTVEIDLTEEGNNSVVETESPQEVVVEAPEAPEEVTEPEPAPEAVQEPSPGPEPAPAE